MFRLYNSFIIAKQQVDLVVIQTEVHTMVGHVIDVDVRWRGVTGTGLRAGTVMSTSRCPGQSKVLSRSLFTAGWCRYVVCVTAQRRRRRRHRRPDSAGVDVFGQDGVTGPRRSHLVVVVVVVAQVENVGDVVPRRSTLDVAGGRLQQLRGSRVDDAAVKGLVPAAARRHVEKHHRISAADVALHCRCPVQ